MKLHTTLVNAVFDNLRLIFKDKNYAADRIIESCFKRNKQFGSRDRKFIAETTYNIVRNWLLLNHLAGVNEAYDHESLSRILSTYFIITDSIFKEVFQCGINEEEIQKKLKEITDPAILHSFPKWLFDTVYNELGDQWLNNVAVLNIEAKAVIRVNTLKTNKEAVKKFLSSEDIGFTEYNQCKDALILEQKKNISSTSAYKSGWMEMQDISSQMVSQMLDVKPGMQVIDACAGAGGKALHLAALMLNKGSIIACDVEKHKLDELKKRASRAGAGCIKTMMINGNDPFAKFASTIDRLLIDAPCTGIGVIKRKPHSKWKINEDLLMKVRTIQQHVLQNYSKVLKPGGKMVYATCSILPSENDMQVEHFLSNNKNFRLHESKTLFPADTGFDGFYMALMERII